MERAEPENKDALALYRVIVTARTDSRERVNHAGPDRAILAAAQQLGLAGLSAVRSQRLYFLYGALNPADALAIGRQLLADPVTEDFSVTPLQTSDTDVFLLSAPDGHRPTGPAGPADGSATQARCVEITYLPGVTDPAADHLVAAARQLGIEGVQRAATGWRYILAGAISDDAVSQLATSVLSNPVVQRLAIDRPIAPPFLDYRPADGTVARIPLRAAGEADLMALSQARRLALDADEMAAIQVYYRREGREPTDVELEMLAQTWSEHCVHKSFRATIDYTGPDGRTETIPGLLNSYIRAATEAVDRPWVRSAFVDNAGIVAFDDRFDLAFKVETHNHPSALEPFGGANTGVGGVVRDVLGVSARPIATTDVLCFGPPDLAPDAVPAGVLHPARIAAGVIQGIEDYGNKMGIPTVNGAVLYHPGYTANPLVYCGCLGLLPRDSHPTAARPGDLIVALGGRTGRDGLRGATFSSMEMDATTGAAAGSVVQIGDPIQEKQVLEVIIRARDERLYHAITDCGAGGFSSAVGEMAAAIGARVQLAAAPLKYPGLQPWEIWLSEAQERMVLAVPPVHWPRLQALCTGQDVTAVCLGTFEPTGRLQLYYGERLVGDLSLAFLHEGRPPRRLRAHWQPPRVAAVPPRLADPAAALLALLARPGIRSKEEIVRRYDHEVQGGTASRPYLGAADHGPGDAAVLVPLDALLADPAGAASPQGLALANGIAPRIGAVDPYYMAWAAVDEAMRNIVAAGGDPDRVALLDNFCWGNPNLPDRLGALVRCAQGCYDAALAYRAPYISGKDSLNNEYAGPDGTRQAIPGTLLISALATVPDVNRTTSMDLKRAGNLLFVVGDTRTEWGGSHLAELSLSAPDRPPAGGAAPAPAPDGLRRLRALHQAIRGGLVRSCHDCAEGGLAVAVAEMAIAGRLGATLRLADVPVASSDEAVGDPARLFAESLSRFVVEVTPDDAAAFRALLEQVPHAHVGEVTAIPRVLVLTSDGHPAIDLPVSDLERAWCGHVTVDQSDRAVGHPPATTHQGRPDPDRQPGSPRATSTPGSRSSAFNFQSSTSLPRVLILHANGTNRDREAALACRLAGGAPEIVHLNQLQAGARRLADYQMLVLPGGFSYGDDLGAGVLWALELRTRFWADLQAFIADGRPVLGICNGFQALVKSGLLPGWTGPAGAGPGGQRPHVDRPVTLTHNQSGRFECRWVKLVPDPDSPCLFTRDLAEPIICPVAHGEGRLVARDPDVAARLLTEGLIALRYDNAASPGPARDVSYPANPNGSLLHIAGLCNPAGNVLGLMPHPENHLFAWQHPRRHRGQAGQTGLQLFTNGLRALL